MMIKQVGWKIKIPLKDRVDVNSCDQDSGHFREKWVCSPTTQPSDIQAAVLPCTAEGKGGWDLGHRWIRVALPSQSLSPRLFPKARLWVAPPQPFLWLLFLHDWYDWMETSWLFSESARYFFPLASMALPVLFCIHVPPSKLHTEPSLMERFNLGKGPM